MKNKPKGGWSTTEIQQMQLVPLLDYMGYFVDRFNDIYSAHRTKTPLAIWPNVFKSGAIVERVTLFDNEGKRRQLSRCKTLIGTLGKEEYEHREALREERAPILAKEKKEYEARLEQEERERLAMLAEIHKDDKPFTGDLNQLDPIVANMLKKARDRKAKREQEALGDLF